MKLNFLMLGVLVAAGVASAATIACPPPNNPAVTAGSPVAGTFNCPAVTATPGFVITGATVTASFTWQDTNGVSTTSLSSIITQNSGQISGLGPFTVTAPLSASVGNTRIGAGSQISGAGTVASLAGLNAFTIGASAPTSVPGTFPANGTITITLNTVETSTGTGGSTPEPTSLILFGSGFLALGLVARARKNRS